MRGRVLQPPNENGRCKVQIIHSEKNDNTLIKPANLSVLDLSDAKVSLSSQL
jgi:hypothetical protein